MSVAHILMGLLTERPMHGYELRAAFEERFGTIWSLNFGQVYPALDKLTEQGLVVIHQEPQGGRDRKVYTITEEGRADLARWLVGEPEPLRIGREETFLRLAVASRMEGAAVQDFVHRQRRAHQVALAELVQIHGALDPRAEVFTALVVEAMMLRTEAELKWLDRVETRLRGPND